MVRKLRDPALVRRRVAQPYSVLVDSEFYNQGDDLWYDLFDEFTHPGGACLRIVVGAAGAGKSVLFRALLTRLYDHFHDRKRSLQVFPRPIPLVPDYLQGVSRWRLPELINNFIHTEVAAPGRQRTFKWMLANGLIMWLVDGLDELYAGDSDFFHQLLEYLTEPDSQAQILICARHSLLRTSETLTNFLAEFRPGPQEAIRVYQINDWEHASKRTYAWISLEGRVPLTGEEDPPQVSQLLTTITRSPLLRALSGLPYYCNLLVGEFKRGTLPEFSDDFSLIEYVISGMIRREEEKGVLRQEQFVHEGLREWLETVAYEFYGERFTGVTRTEVEDYAQFFLREELSEEERLDVITTLIQFPLFAPGAQSGVITFKHELIAEYLAAEYFLKHLSNDPVWAARSLGTRTDLADSLLLCYMASRVAGRPGGLQLVINALRTEALPGRAFANLLQLLLLATPARDVIKANRIVLEGRDLGYVEFKGKDLREISFRNCDLSSATFNACDLHNTSFEGGKPFRDAIRTAV